MEKEARPMPSKQTIARRSPEFFAKLLIIGVAASLAGCNAHPRHRVEVPVAGKLRLDGVTLVDTHDGKLTAGMSILMDKGQIVRIAPTGPSPNDPSIQVIDATGKFVVPGYNDMHAHALGPDDPSGTLALLLADGVTGFRQMSGSPELLKERRDGTLLMGKLAPAMLVMPGSVLTPFNAATTDEAVAEIQRQKRDGADFIKVGLVSPAVFFAAVAEAKRIGLPIAGHLQEGVDAAQASEAGFKSIEHLGPGDTVWIGCSTDEPALRADAARHPALKAPPFKIPFLETIVMARIRKRLINPAAFEDPVDVARLQRAFDTYSDEKCRALAARFVADGTWHVPTLVRLRTQELADLPEYASDAALLTMPADTVRDWREVTDKFHQLPPAMRATFRTAYQRHLALTRMFDGAGVRMMAGTDNGNEVPGQSLHQEFDEVAKAGLSPLKILQMTTLNGAEFLGRTATMGSVAVGKNADLVLLDANPVESVKNLHRIAGVVRAGYYYSRWDLDALKSRVQAGHGYLR
jgi:imidazolonepropionase-like amidohydrolase